MGRSSRYRWATGLALGAAGAKLLRRYRPLLLGWEVTRRCNATCRYCGHGEADDDELGTGEALALIGQMRAAGVRAVGLTGGEPLLRPDLPELVEALARERIATSLNTNGFRVSHHEATLRRLHAVKISLDGPRAIHDSIRGAGSWRRAVDAIDLCRRWSVPVTVQAVLSRDSLDTLDDLVQWCARRELPLVVNPLDPGQLAPGTGQDCVPDGASLRGAVEGLARLPRSTRPRVSRAALRHLARWPSPTPMRCASGRISARLRSNGDLVLCGQPPRRSRPISCRDRGLAAAFRELEPVACASCWCALRVDANLGWSTRGMLAALPRLAREGRAR